MGSFEIERIVSVPPQQVWDVITDWAGHARWIPLTTMRLDQGLTRVGFSCAGLTNKALFSRVIGDLAAEAVRACGRA
jgi:hypothetical protein